MRTVEVMPTECWEAVMKAPDKDCPKCGGTGATHVALFPPSGLSCVCVIAGWRNAPELLKPITLKIAG